MKKTIILFTALAVILISSSLFAVMMATGILKKGSDSDVIFNNNNNNEKKYIKYQLIKSDIDISQELNGYVKYNVDTKGNYEQKEIGVKFQMLVKPGDLVKKGEVLYYNNDGESVTAQKDLLVVGLSVDTDMYMETFVYEASQICISIPAKYQEILGDIIFSTIGNNGEEVVLDVQYISPYITDGNIDITLKNVFQVLDNTEITVCAKYYTIEDKIAVPVEYVFFDNGEPYIHIVDDGEKDYYIDVYYYNDDIYIINDDLEGVIIGYTLEEKYMDKAGRDND